jgi:glycerate kinase
MDILVAPNAFKNSINAADAALEIQKGLLRSSPSFHCTCFPIGDGGDGTAKLIIEKFNGTEVSTVVRDPLGRMVKSAFGLIEEGKTAVIEMADASGLRLLSAGELSPLLASSYGTGELISQALDKGVDRIVLCMGGSATVDGGTGILNALGMKFFGPAGEFRAVVPENLMDLAGVDTAGLDARIWSTELTILCDVDNLLLGDTGSAAVFGPQKGASADDVERLELALSRFRDVALRETGKDMALLKHGGAAGGAAAGLATFIDAHLVNGIDEFLKLTGFAEALEKCDVVITGEGSIDEQTLQGKGPFGVARMAKLKGLPVIAFAGMVPLVQNDQLHQYFDVLMAIGNGPSDLGTAIHQAAINLERSAFAAGNFLKLRPEL